MKVVGVDYGSSRIGIAVADLSLRLAFSRPFVPGVGDLKKDASNIAKFARDEGATLVVVGLPLLESGKEGEQARISKQLGSLLSELGLSVIFWDERFTTAAARINLEMAPKKKRDRLVDSEAARIMLVDFLAKGDE